MAEDKEVLVDVQEVYSKTERYIEEIVSEISEYDPAQVFNPDILGYDKSTIFMAKIIHMQDCSYLVGC